MPLRQLHAPCPADAFFVREGGETHFPSTQTLAEMSTVRLLDLMVEYEEMAEEEPHLAVRATVSLGLIATALAHRLGIHCEAYVAVMLDGITASEWEGPLPVRRRVDPPPQDRRPACEQERLVSSRKVPVSAARRLPRDAARCERAVPPALLPTAGVGQQSREGLHTRSTDGVRCGPATEHVWGRCTLASSPGRAGRAPAAAAPLPQY